MNSTLDSLPVFATDLQICQAIVGKERATQWKKTMLPVMARKPGFPKVDLLHGGRSTPLIRTFYADYMRLPGYSVMFESRLDQLPLFATDEQIAIAMVGTKHASAWLTKTMPALEAKMPGFPRLDLLHDARAVPVLKVFYANYFRLAGANQVLGQEEEKEDFSEWKKRGRKPKSVWSGSA